MDLPKFPTISDDQMRELLAPPSGEIRVVIDTDTRNEIDDQFTLAWALLSQDRLKIEGIYAEPFSFQYRIAEVEHARALAARTDPPLTPEEQELVERNEARLRRYESVGLDHKSLHLTPPEDGMERSYQEIFTVYEKMGMSAEGLAFRGSPRYLTSYDDPVSSPAAEHLIERALDTSSGKPLYIVAIGCVTNVASAILMAPEIIPNIVVTWTSGYPTTFNRPNDSFNLEQDMPSSKLLFSCGVPLVYLPGYHVGAQLRLSLPDVEAWVKGRGEIGDYLHHLYTNNPLQQMFGISEHFARTWIIWDLINVAWLLNPSWAASQLLRAPALGDDKRWIRDLPNRHLIREAYEIDRDAIFRDFFQKLDNFANQ